MAIEEKKKPLEFEFIDDNAQKTVYEIRHENDDRDLSIIVRCGDIQMAFSPNFFNEVPIFLRSKGILKNQVLTRGVVPSPQSSSPVGLSVPNVQMLDDSEMQENVFTSQPMSVDPLASFDISLTTNPSPVAPVESSKVSKEIIGRPVIRTRITDSPMSAEEEGARIRGSGRDGKVKTIKRKEE